MNAAGAGNDVCWWLAAGGVAILGKVPPHSGELAEAICDARRAAEEEGHLISARQRKQIEAWTTSPGTPTEAADYGRELLRLCASDVEGVEARPSLQRATPRQIDEIERACEGVWIDAETTPGTTRVLTSTYERGDARMLVAFDEPASASRLRVAAEALHALRERLDAMDRGSNSPGIATIAIPGEFTEKTTG